MANNRPTLAACTPNGKMVSYGKGVAPTLNYQIPQKTSFTTYGDIGLNLPASFFKINARAIPEEVLQYNRMSVAEIAAFLKSKKSFPTQNVPLALKKLSDIKLASAVNAEFKTPSVSSDSEGAIQGLTLLDSGYSIIPEQTVQNAYIDKLSVLLKEGKAVEIFDKFGNFDTEVIVTQRPAFPDARLFIIEEYKTASFLGDYGAGETVKLFRYCRAKKRQ
ncbi:MAG: hypothetical protein HC817_11595 [Saprospiraceae bacterium]|nr:hypothetical protein [Saprospiraceae bacterium]